MATATLSDIQFSGLTKCLIKEGLLTETDAGKSILKRRKQQKLPLTSFLVSNKIIDSKIIATFASIEFGVPFFDLDAIDQQSMPVSLVSEKLIQTTPCLTNIQKG